MSSKGYRTMFGCDWTTNYE